MAVAWMVGARMAVATAAVAKGVVVVRAVAVRAVVGGRLRVVPGARVERPVAEHGGVLLDHPLALEDAQVRKVVGRAVVHQQRVEGAQAVLGGDGVELTREVADLDLDLVAQPRMLDHLPGVRRARAREGTVARRGAQRLRGHLGRNGSVERVDLDRYELATGW